MKFVKQKYIWYTLAVYAVLFLNENVSYIAFVCKNKWGFACFFHCEFPPVRFFFDGKPETFLVFVRLKSEKMGGKSDCLVTWNVILECYTQTHWNIGVGM